MDDEEDRQRVFSLQRGPLHDQGLGTTPTSPSGGPGGTGLLEEIDDAVYENLRFRRHPEAFSSHATLAGTPKRFLKKHAKDDHADCETKDFVDNDPTYSTIPKRHFNKHVRTTQQDSDAVDSDNDTEIKAQQKAAYRQELRKSSLQHVSDTNSIPVLEGLRQWASYRRISREQSQEDPNRREKIYDVPDIPNGNLNPWITHRRAPKSYPELPQTWDQSNEDSGQQTIVSPLESYNWPDILQTGHPPAGTDAELSELHAPPRKPPPRLVKKKTKPILKRPINITKNDLNSNSPQGEAKTSWFRRGIGRFKGPKGNSETLGPGGPESDRASEERRKKQPFFYCRLIAQYPKTAFGK